MAKLLTGAEVVSAMNEWIRADAAALSVRGVTPSLAILRVGEKSDDLAYERAACKRAETVGVAVRRIALPQTVSQEVLLGEIEAVNRDAAIHGCLILRPLPAQIDDAAVRAALLPEKDVDGITDGSLAGVFTGGGCGYPPCTAQACLETLDHYGIDPAGKNVAVIGRSLVVGRPVAMLLLQRNASVTICHTKTVDLPAVARRAEILVAAAGRAGVVGAAYAAPGQTVLDVGINFTPEGGMIGDVDFPAVEPVVRAITPVPGGIGTVTNSVLMAHVVQACLRAERAT